MIIVIYLQIPQYFEELCCVNDVGRHKCIPEPSCFDV